MMRTLLVSILLVIVLTTAALAIGGKYTLSGVQGVQVSYYWDTGKVYARSTDEVPITSKVQAGGSYTLVHITDEGRHATGKVIITNISGAVAEGKLVANF